MGERVREDHDPILQSIIRIELLDFFQANPHTRDTVSGLATRLHRPSQQVEMAADALAALGILEMGGSRKITVYSLKHGEMIDGYFKEKKLRVSPGKTPL